MKKIIFFILIFAISFSAPAANLKMIRASNAPNSSRISFVLDAPVSYQLFLLENPKRLVIDFDKTALTYVGLDTLKINGISQIRMGRPMPGKLRLVLDISSDVQYKTFLSANKKQLYVDLYYQSSQPVAREPVMTEKKKSVFVVVIDPGHGGKDTGAIGANGVSEKNVVLAISKKLADFINREPGMKAVLTRKGDYFIPLRDRLRLARRGKADLFIAVHADAYFNNLASGASVYALSQRGATSEAARWLAKKENYSELGGVDLGELDDQSYMLRSVLIDLAQTATTTDSLRLGTSILDALDDMTRLHYSRVEQAPFVVLKSPDIPSVLVETGFISNLKEEKHLNNSAYQMELANALFSGIKIYIKKYAVD